MPSGAPSAAANNAAVPSDLLHELFERQAGSRPDSIGVLFGTERLTYGEVERRAKRLAHFLRARGIAHRNCVCLLLPRAAARYGALLAILQARAACSPPSPAATA